MASSFKIFAIAYFSLILSIVICCLFNIIFEALTVLIGLVAATGIAIVILALFARWAERHKISLNPALPEEIKREDDVLLQGVAFISSILFFYVNLVLNVATEKIFFSIVIVSISARAKSALEWRS